MAESGLYTSGIMQHEHEYHPLAVVEVVDETADTRSFVLDVPPALESTFAYTAGQFCTFRATIDGEPVVRSYSMSSSPDLGEPLTTTVKRVPGGLMSNWMNDHVAAGDQLDVMRPTGLFVLRDTDVPIVAFAGGSGITPVISIVKSALATTERPIVLVYANRDAGAVIFADELARLAAGAAGRLSVHHHLDTERGYLDAAACTALVGDRDHADFYVCGPGAYMEVVEEALTIRRRRPGTGVHRTVRRAGGGPRRRPDPDRIAHDHTRTADADHPVPTGRHHPRGGSARRAEARRSRARWATARRAWRTSTTDRRRCAPTTH